MKGAKATSVGYEAIRLAIDIAEILEVLISVLTDKALQNVPTHGNLVGTQGTTIAGVPVQDCTNSCS